MSKMQLYKSRHRKHRVLVERELRVHQPSGMAATGRRAGALEASSREVQVPTSSHSCSGHLSSEMWVSSRGSSPKGTETPGLRDMGQHSRPHP